MIVSSSMAQFKGRSVPKASNISQNNKPKQTINVTKITTKTNINMNSQNTQNVNATAQLASKLQDNVILTLKYIVK